jgi:GT2 family glycosyltransferase
MNIGIIVASHRRPKLVYEFLSAIQEQSLLPTEIVLSVVETGDVPDFTAINLPIKIIYGKAGSCVQRNKGIDYLCDKVDVIVFFDDDFFPGRNYLEQLELIFIGDRTIVGITGNVIADGATGRGYEVCEACKLIADYETRQTWASGQIKEVPDTYGCNMAFRSQMISYVRFDERLLLYGWQEDVDFSAQLRTVGRVVWTDKIWGVHLGTKLGKTSGRRFGYSQVVNPFYVAKKGNMASSRAAIMVTKNILANMVRSVVPEPYIDRRGRLRGNIIGLLHLARGRLNPEYVIYL